MLSDTQILRRLSGWGNYPVTTSAILRPERVTDLAGVLGILSTTRSIIARGAGLAYGDASINDQRHGYVLSTARLKRFLAFDAERGTIRCQAGVPLSDVLQITLPAGWILPVTPGTSRATVGGCIACDVHGKNHHFAGSFGQHVLELNLLLADGSTVTCSPQIRADFFWATVGGMGLTGIIIDATLALTRIESSWVLERDIVTRDLDDTIRVLIETRAVPYSVAWIDATADRKERGRGVVMLGEHARTHQLPRELREERLSIRNPSGFRTPLGLPRFAHRLGLARAMNAVLYGRYARSSGGPRPVSFRSYFYPLDAIENWNQLYGRAGFIEYQAIVPEARASVLIRDVLDMLAAAGQPSYFASLKLMGLGNQGPLSFPMPGVAFSFDVPQCGELLPLLDRIDEKLAAAGGRVYLAKDARCRADVMDTFYPGRRAWAQLVRRGDPTAKFSSDMARRLRLRL